MARNTSYKNIKLKRHSTLILEILGQFSTALGLHHHIMIKNVD